MKIGIIGAGATGLTAAYELGKAGHNVIVYERASFIGGQASTFDIGGVSLERGYHHLFTTDNDISTLIVARPTTLCCDWWATCKGKHRC